MFRIFSPGTNIYFLAAVSTREAAVSEAEEKIKYAMDKAPDKEKAAYDQIKTVRTLSNACFVSAQKFERRTSFVHLFRHRV